MAILVVAEHDNGELKAANANVLTAAAAIGGDITVLVVGDNCAAVAAAAAELGGVKKVLVAEAAHYAHGLAEPLAILLQSMSGDYDHIVFSAGTFGRNVLPRLAGLLGLAAVTDVTEVKDGKTFVRPIYAGNAMATVKVDADKILLTVRATSFAPIGKQAAATIDKVAAAADPGLSRFIKLEKSKSDRPELTSAKIVISGGRGLASGDNFKLLEALADKLGAAMGASRAAVDAGFVPNDWQVGQTGKIVAPDLYIAVGISGAIQHLAGIKDAKVIVAINKDEEAPIFQVATYGLVADLFRALPEMTEKL